MKSWRSQVKGKVFGNWCSFGPFSIFHQRAATPAGEKIEKSGFMKKGGGWIYLYLYLVLFFIFICIFVFVFYFCLFVFVFVCILNLYERRREGR